MFKYIQLKPKLEECLHISLHITKSFDCSSSFSVLSPLTKEAYKAGKSIQNPHKINERLSFNLLFLLFNVFFFLLKGLFTIKYFWPKTAKRSFYFSQKPVFQSGSARFACEQALLFGRTKRAVREHVSERRSREVPVPLHPAFASSLACFSRVYFSR